MNRYLSDGGLNKQIRRKMRDIRLERGKKQVEVGKMIGVTPQHYQQTESGNTPPNLRILEKLCKAYDIHISYFFIDTDLSIVKEDGSIFFEFLSTQDIVLLRDTATLSPEAKESLFEFIRFKKFQENG